jgi:hypothetical protein
MDAQAALARNRKAWLDVLERTRTPEEAVRADEASTTKLWWSSIPNVNDDRVALIIADPDSNPLLTPEELAALLTEEEAIADGFYVPNPFRPINTVPPNLTFTTASPGKAVSCMPGTWTGDPVPTYKYQWQADGADLIQAVTSVHTVTLADVGKVLTCVVTATNTNGSASAVSNECNAIALAARTAARKAPAKKTPAKKK